MTSRSRALLIAGTILVVGMGIWYGKATEVTAAITTIYVILVFLQLDLMKRQHESAQSERLHMAELEMSRRPELHLLDMCVRRTTEVHTPTEEELGPALYINCTVTNTGGSLANRVQPVLTNAAERLPDGRWRVFPDWIQLGLRWCLDEIGASQGQPTQDRYIVPHRPYEFDLGKLSTYMPTPKLELCTLIKPNSQPNDFAAGEYCLEVTVYSENAAPARMWYLVTVDRDAHAPSPLRVQQLSGAPWAA